MSNITWAEALAEADTPDRRDANLWARCFAEADGDVGKAKAAYIKARVNAQEATTDKIADTATGWCPNCANSCLLSDTYCKKCNMHMTGNYRPRPDKLARRINESPRDQGTNRSPSSSGESNYGNIFPDMRAQDDKKSNLFGWIVLGVIAVAIGSCMLNTPKSTAPNGTDALAACQTAIRQIAKDPDTAKIPYVNGTENSSEFTFAWNRETSLIRMRNGLGLEVPASATCVFSKSGNRINLLQLNGQTIFSR